MVHKNDKDAHPLETMNCRRRFRVLRVGAATLLLQLICAPAIAQGRDLPHPALSASPPLAMSCALCGTRWQPSMLAAASVAPSSGLTMRDRHRTGSVRDATASTDVTRRLVAFDELAFRDNQPLVNRLKRIQAVAVVTVWDSTSATLYVGVNRDGEPGLHLRQKKHDRGTLAPANRTLFSDITPWRAARLVGQSRAR